jgi:hypothetical protein
MLILNMIKLFSCLNRLWGRAFTGLPVPTYRRASEREWQADSALHTTACASAAVRKPSWPSAGLRGEHNRGQSGIKKALGQIAARVDLPAREKSAVNLLTRLSADLLLLPLAPGRA